MLQNPFEEAIEKAWEVRDTITSETKGEIRDSIDATLHSLDCGTLRVAEKMDSGIWHVNQWAKKAVLLGFRLQDMGEQNGGPQGGGWWDKVDSKFKGWSKEDWKMAGFRAVPNCVVRRSAFVGQNVVLMPSFVNPGVSEMKLSKLTGIGIQSLSFEAPAMQDRLGVTRWLRPPLKNKIAGSLKGNGCVKIICHRPIERISHILSINNRCHIPHDFHGKLLGANAMMDPVGNILRGNP